MRLLASMLLLLAAAGCDRRGTDISQSLRQGDAAFQSMGAAATVRDYDVYFQQYEALRSSYISVATEIRQSGAQADRDEHLHTLQRWERAITKARAFWSDLNNPSPAVIEMPVGVRPEVADTVQQLVNKSQKFDDKSQRTRDRISAEWAPIESELDESIAAMHDLQSN